MDLALHQVGTHHHAIRRFEMLYSGFVRVTIGAIAAAVAIMLIKGGWILAAIEPCYLVNPPCRLPRYSGPHQLRSVPAPRATLPRPMNSRATAALYPWVPGMEEAIR